MASTFARTKNRSCDSNNVHSFVLVLINSSTAFGKVFSLTIASPTARVLAEFTDFTSWGDLRELQERV